MTILLSPVQRLRKREQGAQGIIGKGTKRSVFPRFLLSSQRSPRANRFLAQPSNIFIAPTYSPSSPIQGTSAVEKDYFT